MELAFAKYQGTGNDFVVIDDRAGVWEPRLDRAAVARLCDRRFGIGGDGLILLCEAPGYDFRMKYFNADGGESTLCGNGARCLTAFARRQGIVRAHYTFLAIDGPHHSYCDDGLVHLQMLAPQGYRAFGPDRHWIDTGSPHLVCLADTPVAALDVQRQGSDLRYDSQWAASGGTNVNFVNRIDAHSLRMRTYERGVEAETLSCGTGAVACAYVHYLLEDRQPRHIVLHTPGGNLGVQIEVVDGEEKVWLTGPAVFVFEGHTDLPQ
ncbi:MAG: diaminopimelate epimerase [Bacteroidia bacterium]